MWIFENKKIYGTITKAAKIKNSGSAAGTL